MRYSVRLIDNENGVRVERTLSIEAESPRRAEKMALALYGSDEATAVTLHRETYLEHRQHRYGWAAKPSGEGTFASVEYVPIGPGARTGKATQWKPTREAHFPTRKAAKDCAQKWYEAAIAEDVGASAAANRERQVILESRAAFIPLDPSLGSCKDCGGQLHVRRGQSDERLAVCTGEDDGEPQSISMEARPTRGCGQTFRLPQRGIVGPSGRTCACGWPLIEVVPPYIRSSPWLQCIDPGCRNPQQEWHQPEG